MESWSYHRYLRGLWHVWLPPLVLWVPEGYPACAGLWRPVGDLKERVGTPIERIADIDAWRPEASMPGWPGWLACLAWLGWLGWIDWNDCLKSSTLDALEEVGGFLMVDGGLIRIRLIH